MAYPKGLTVRPVRNGLGIVALRSFRHSALICEIKGRIVSASTMWRYWETDPRLAENCFRYSAERYLNPEGEIGQYANHSCQSNAGIVKQGRGLWLKAIANIARGDEVTHDYSTLLGTDDVWEMRCNCGAANCRRRVRHIGTLPASVIRRYRQYGIIPAFILASI
jgi:SET domain-containing protein